MTDSNDTTQPNTGPRPPAAPPVQPQHPAAPGSLAGFEILEEIGAGGMGVVFRATQTALKRTVAIKMIRAGLKPGRTELARFRFEAEAVARLQHPNIVQVFAVSEWEGQPYLALEYLEGGTLAKRIGAKPQAASAAAEMIETLAKAVHYAHSRGILHRDLKPANVLLTAEGVPKIVDFGIARQLDSDQVSQPNAIVGSPSYMAPEQAWGSTSIRDLSPAVDVYALGAVLYEMLTGKPPFQGTSTRQTLEMVWRERPAPPSAVTPGVPRDLEIICLKCLEKDPLKRYASAADLAEDLRRFRKGEPITARKVGAAERGWSWCRRNPLPAALLVALLISILAGITGVVLKFLDEQDQRRIAQKNEGIAKGEEAKAIAALDTAAKERAKAVYQSYVSSVAAADREYWSADIAAMRERMSKVAIDPSAMEDPRGFEWHMLRRRLESHDTRHELGPGEVLALSPSPDGKRIAVVVNQAFDAQVIAADTGQQLFTLDGHEMRVLDVSFSPDGRTIATGSHDGTVRLWDAVDGKPLATIKSGHGAVTDVEFSPDSKRLATGHADKTAAVWNVEDRKAPKLACLFEGHAKKYPLLKPGENAENLVAYPRTRIAFDADGTRVVSTVGNWTAERTHTALLLLRNAEELAEGDDMRQSLDAVRRQATPQLIGAELAIWDAATADETARIVSDRELNCVAISSDGVLVVAGADNGKVLAWDVTASVRLEPREGHRGSVRDVAFIGKSRRVVSAGWDRTVNVWEFASRPATPPTLTLRPHEGRINCIAVSLDEIHLLTGGSAHPGAKDLGMHRAEIKTWDLRHEQGVKLFRADDQRVTTLAFKPDRPHILATGGRTGSLRIWNALTGERINGLTGNYPTTAITYSPNSQWLAVAAGNGVVVFDALTMNPIVTYKKHQKPVAALAFSADSRYILSADAGPLGSELHLWYAIIGDQIWTRTLSVPGRKSAISGKQLPDSSVAVQQIVADGERFLVTGEAIGFMAGGSVAFAIPMKKEEQPTRLDGRFTLATPSHAKTKSRLWTEFAGVGQSPTIVLRGADDQPFMKFEARGAMLDSSLSPDGRRLILSRWQSDRANLGELQLFDTGTGQELLKWQTPGGNIGIVRISPDGQLLATTGDDGVVRVWDARAMGK